jgi:hypothetical protein
MIAKAIFYFENPCAVACDARCDKAWGINSRPKIEFDPEEPDDYAYKSDRELGLAPVDPGTYEGGHGKPQHPDERLNKWCVRECERSRMGKEGELIKPPDFSRRRFNMPWRHSEQRLNEEA